MYTMTINDRPFYDPTRSKCTLESPLLTLEANKIGTLTFTVYPDNQEYSSITLRQSIIKLYRDGVLYMEFRPVRAHRTFQGGVEYTCEEMTAYLNDFLHRPESFEGTPDDFITLCVQEFNAQNTRTKIITPAKYIRQLMNPFQRDLLMQTGGGIYYEYHRDDIEFEIEHNVGLSDGHPKIVYLNSLLAVLGYYGNVYIPPTNGEDFTTYGRFASYHNIRFGRSPRWTPSSPYDYNQYFYGEAWEYEVMDIPAFVDALYADMMEIMAELPEDPDDDDEWDQQTSEYTPVVFGVGDMPSDMAEMGSFTLEKGEYIGFWDYMQKSLVDQFGGFIVPRWTENVCTLNYYKEKDLPICDQSIRFGENLSDMFIDTDSEKVYSIIIPLGKEGLTINHSAPTEPDYLGSEEAVGLYGPKEITKEWDEIDNEQKLKSVASQWLVDNAIRLKDEFEVNAYDLRYAGVDVGHLEFMYRVPVSNEKLGINQLCPLMGVEIPLDSPINDVYRLNGELDSLVDKIKK